MPVQQLSALLTNEEVCLVARVLRMVEWPCWDKLGVKCPFIFYDTLNWYIWDSHSNSGHFPKRFHPSKLREAVDLIRLGIITAHLTSPKQADETVFAMMEKEKEQW